MAEGSSKNDYKTAAQILAGTTIVFGVVAILAGNECRKAKIWIFKPASETQASRFTRPASKVA